jgi:hypothetical protein
VASFGVLAAKERGGKGTQPHQGGARASLLLALLRTFLTLLWLRGAQHSEGVGYVTLLHLDHLCNWLLGGRGGVIRRRARGHPAAGGEARVRAGRACGGAVGRGDALLLAPWERERNASSHFWDGWKK